MLVCVAFASLCLSFALCLFAVVCLLFACLFVSLFVCCLFVCFVACLFVCFFVVCVEVVCCFFVVPLLVLRSFVACSLTVKCPLFCDGDCAMSLYVYSFVMFVLCVVTGSLSTRTTRKTNASQLFTISVLYTCILNVFGLNLR